MKNNKRGINKKMKTYTPKTINIDESNQRGASFNTHTHTHTHPPNQDVLLQI